MCKLFLNTNIPSNKLSHFKLHSFFENYTKKKKYGLIGIKKKNYEQNQNICFRKKILIDEISYENNRYVANAIFGTLEIDSSGKTFKF